MNNNTFIYNVKKINNLSNNFNKYHRDNVNVFIHLITTPLSILEITSIINKITGHTIIAKILCIFYCISLIYKDLPFNVICITSYILANIIIFSQKIKMKYLYNIIIFIIGYLIQDLSHYITGEQTYQSSYVNNYEYNELLFEHTYYLLPLIIISAIKSKIIYKKYPIYKIICITPLIKVFITDYLVKKEYIEYPWQFNKYKVIKKRDYSNLYYILTLFTISYYTDYKIFLIGTSFVHYIRYILTYYYRDNVDYIKFKNDVIFYKMISMFQLYSLYLLSFQNTNDIYNNIIGILFIIIGNSLSFYSSYLLGVDGCYFGIELGYVNKKKNYISKFPYGYIPHPMILSQCFALYGMNKNTIFYYNWSYLVYTHMLFYIIHIIQEHFDIYNILKLPMI